MIVIDRLEEFGQKTRGFVLVEYSTCVVLFYSVVINRHLWIEFRLQTQPFVFVSLLRFFAYVAFK